MESHAQVRERLPGEILTEFQKTNDSAEIENGIRKFLEWIKSGKLEVRAYFRQGKLDKFFLAAPGKQPTVELDFMSAAKILKPTDPKEARQSIVAELDALQAEVDALRRLQAEAATELDALLPAILDRAFKGELQSC